jgi:hypothetical protein
MVADSKGENPRTIHTGGWLFLIAGAYSPAGSNIIIPVSGVPRLAAEAYRLTNPSSLSPPLPLKTNILLNHLMSYLLSYVNEGFRRSDPF